MATTPTQPLKKVIISLPGKEYSSSFLMSWSETLLKLTQQGYQVALTSDYSEYTPFTRMKSLGLDNLRGNDQKPFDGKVDYDVWLTIDSNIIFSPKQVIELIEDTDKYPVISGVHRLPDMKSISAVRTLSDEYFHENGAYEYIKVDTLDKDIKHFDVEYSSMGFMACKKGVIESLTHPYFNYPVKECQVGDKTISHILPDDASFCKRLADAGHKITVNTDLFVGNEKRLII
mgnify:FL=1